MCFRVSERFEDTTTATEIVTAILLLPEMFHKNKADSMYITYDVSFHS